MKTDEKLSNNYIIMIYRIYSLLSSGVPVLRQITSFQHWKILSFRETLGKFNEVVVNLELFSINNWKKMKLLREENKIQSFLNRKKLKFYEKLWNSQAFKENFRK